MLIARAFGAALKGMRAEVGIAQESLSINAGLDPRWAGTLEQGRSCPSLPVLMRLAQALGREPAELVARTARNMRDGNHETGVMKMPYVDLKGTKERLAFMREGIRAQEGFNWIEYEQLCSDALARIDQLERGVERVARLAGSGADLQIIHDELRQVLRDPASAGRG